MLPILLDGSEYLWNALDNKKPAEPYAVRVSWTSLVTVGPVFGGAGGI